MSTLKEYGVDKDLYYRANHSVFLITTEYTYKSDLLVHLLIEKNLSIRLNEQVQYVFHQDANIKNEQFFYKKSYSLEKAKPISKVQFHNKLQRLDMAHTLIEQEVVEEYDYVGRDGHPDRLQIAVYIKSDDLTAIIEFKDKAQQEYFIGPIWLIC